MIVTFDAYIVTPDQRERERVNVKGLKEAYAHLHRNRRMNDGEQWIVVDETVKRGKFIRSRHRDEHGNMYIIEKVMKNPNPSSLFRMPR